MTTGTNGNDTIKGSLTGPDEILGLGGDDLITGGPHGNVILGNQGNDTVYGGAGDDVIHGGQGDDALVGEEGNDAIYGGQGNDLIWGNQGNDTITGGGNYNDLGGPASVAGGQGNDLIFGTAANDYLLGNQGNDVIHGGDGNDTAHGGQGNDAVDAGNGNDVVYLSVGNDTLEGGAGEDRLIIVGDHSNFDITDLGGGKFHLVDKVGNQGDNYVSGFEIYEFINGDGSSSIYANNSLVTPTPPPPPPVPTDTITYNPSANLNPTAHNPDNTVNVGAGNMADDYAVVHNVTQGVEIGFKPHIRQASVVNGDYAATQNADGTFSVNVAAGSQSQAGGAQSDNPNRAHWNLDYSLDVDTNGSGRTLADVTAVLRIDTDPTTGVHYEDFVMTLLGPGNTPWVHTSGIAGGAMGDDDGTTHTDLSQNSINFGFAFLANKIDEDPVAAGIQPYTFGPGMFDVTMDVYDKVSGDLLGSNTIHVNVTADSSLLVMG